MAPVVRVDYRPVGDGTVGPIARTIQETCFDVVRGRRPEYRAQWCTLVYAEVPTSKRSEVTN